MDSIVNNIAKSLSQSQEQYEVNVFALKWLLHTITGFSLIYTVAYFLGVLKVSLIISLTAYILRSFSGGGHSKSPVTCIVLSVAYVNIAAITVIKYCSLLTNTQALAGTLVLLGIGVILIKFYAPADTPQKPIISDAFRKKLKKKSYIFLFTLMVLLVIDYNIGFQFPELYLAVFAGLLWQLLSITPLGYIGLHRLDSIVDYIGQR